MLKLMFTVQHADVKVVESADADTKTDDYSAGLSAVL